MTTHEPNPFTLCPHCGSTFHEDDAHECEPTDNKPTTKPVAKQVRGDTTYHLFANGELWTAGKWCLLCGEVSHPDDLDKAIDNHEQAFPEDLRILIAQAEANVRQP